MKTDQLELPSILQADPHLRRAHGISLHISFWRLVALVVLLVLPWTAVCGYLLVHTWGNRPNSDPSEGAVGDLPMEEVGVDLLRPVSRGRPGPWGDLVYTRIALELPDEFVFVPPDDAPPVRWYFAGESRAKAVERLRKAGVAPEALKSLDDARKWEEGNAGTWLTPGDPFILGMDPATRYNLYSHLIAAKENSKFVDPYCYREALLGERLRGAKLMPSSVDLFRRLLYSSGSSLKFFADTEPALRQLPGRGERQRFMKAVSRKLTLMAKLRVRSASSVEGLVDYWGVGGRRKDLRPLLQSLTNLDDDCVVDIIHLLPRFVRTNLYTFPNISGDPAVSSQDCFYSAFNFFAEQPDPQFTSLDYVAKVLARDYTGIVNPSQLGDIVFISTDAGTVVHAAAYIADDIVFTKNGASYTQPWVLARIKDLVDIYRRTAKSV